MFLLLNYIIVGKILQDSSVDFEYVQTEYIYSVNQRKTRYIFLLNSINYSSILHNFVTYLILNLWRFSLIKGSHFSCYVFLYFSMLVPLKRKK
ncbi:hypothetical protein CCYN49044_80007 [Capnocytophaga cynodegmi]|uniref:Uncharacterized protein n=1 Tax=Capnocytophaga cynodegmi TaxID=28189 RepID=A0A0B7HWI1_9FLAO|nr:hypothetical protein CCYN74_50008 [Capnocytophaga cynodegmi]CEN42242.1 hypothetical protein CCYN49044_80007 [Capnocytophaga cynodegmi]